MAKYSRLEIDTQRLQNDIDALRAQLSQMQKRGDSMMSGIHALSAMWEGAAKDAFTAQFQSDYETLQAMEACIENLVKQLEFAKGRYQTCESNVASIVESIRV